MSDRRPRASYDGARYPRPPGALSRRSALLRLGGIGGLLLVGTSPWSGLMAGRARARSGDGWTLFIPLEGNLRVLRLGDMFVAYRVTLLVTSSAVLDCIESDEWRILRQIDFYLQGLNEDELLDPDFRPQIEATVTDLIAAVCPPPRIRRTTTRPITTRPTTTPTTTTPPPPMTETPRDRDSPFWNSRSASTTRIPTTSTTMAGSRGQPRPRSVRCRSVEQPADAALRCRRGASHLDSR